MDYRLTPGEGMWLRMLLRGIACLLILFLLRLAYMFLQSLGYSIKASYVVWGAALLLILLIIWWPGPRAEAREEASAGE